MASLLSSLPLLLFSLYLTSANHELGTNFTFHGFLPSNFTLDGTANVTSNGLLRLTDNLTAIQTSHAILSNPVHFGANGDSPPLSFSTNFVFAIVPPYPGLGVFGMAFLIAPRDRINVGKRSPKYLGLFNKHTNGSASNHIVAVEFNLLPNPHLRSFRDNHVDIDVNSAVHVNSTPAGYYTGTKHHNLIKMNLMSGEPIQAWVDYSARDEKLEVTIAPLNVTSRPTRPLCSTHVNLTGVLLEDMHLGFSGSAGRGSVTQYVLGWSFRLNGKADPLDLSKLPKLPRPKEKHSLHASVVVVLALAVAAVVVAAIGAVYAYRKWKEKYAEVLEDWEHEYGPHRISFRDIYKATKGFKESELLGTGGFGKVYRGVMPKTEAVVAVKRVSHESRQGIREFVAEVVSVGRLRHRNLVALLGYCRRRGELLLVYDYMPHGSLDSLLFDNRKSPLDWNTRLKIIKGVASALLYLHEEWEQVVLHRDVKASNVLLDANNDGKLGDFGLARLYDHGEALQTTRVVGTMGYLAPELARSGRASKATDVFSFGVFVLEVVCGRKPIESRAAREETILLDWVMRRWAVEGKSLADAADARMRGAYKDLEVEMMMKLGLLCAHADEEARPSMRQVVQVLDGELALPELTMEEWRRSIGVTGLFLQEKGGGKGSTSSLHWSELSGASATASTAAASVATGSIFLTGGR